MGLNDISPEWLQGCGFIDRAAYDPSREAWSFSLVKDEFELLLVKQYGEWKAHLFWMGVGVPLPPVLNYRSDVVRLVRGLGGHLLLSATGDAHPTGTPGTVVPATGVTAP